MCRVSYLLIIKIFLQSIAGEARHSVSSDILSIRVGIKPTTVAFRHILVQLRYNDLNWRYALKQQKQIPDNHEPLSPLGYWAGWPSCASSGQTPNLHNLV